VVRATAALMVCALAAFGTGCARPRAETVPEMPPLALPVPPPRVLPPLDGIPIGAAGPDAPEPPRQRPPQRSPAQGGRPGGDNGRADARTETPKPEAPADLEAPPEPSAPASALQLAPAADAARLEQNIRVLLQRAGTDLNRIDTRTLSADARTQYDTARRFIILSDQAIRDRNLVYAQTLADKARTIAAVLLGR
jgi:hypothetical protein